MQLGLILAAFMTLVSYTRFVHAALVQRAAIKQAKGGKLPDTLLPDQADPQDAVETKKQSTPMAAVVRAPSLEGPAPTFHDVSIEDPAAVFPHAREDPEPSFPMPPQGSSQHPLYDSDGVVVVDVAAPQGGKVAGPVAEASTEGKPDQKSHAANGSRNEDKVLLQESSVHTEDVEDSAEAAAEAARRSKRGVAGFFQHLWNSVKEDPRSGFRCTSAYPCQDFPLDSAIDHACVK